MRKAAEIGRAPYMVFKDSALDDMCEKRPRTVDALLSCKGIGAETARKYGTELLSIINPGSAYGAASAAVCAAIPEAKSRHGDFWSPLEEEVLIRMYMDGVPQKTMAIKLGRSNYAVQLKLEGLLQAQPPQHVAVGQGLMYA
ncbi:hypothetical protein HYH03_015490 [Edaphochlamys debaryana]|uniref:HRDC domain-containing protein n=1 Tax=Edaphochlamys debaryana TaxID=47281 RepID=A0A835XKI6_9CHLO|nr:hypothetical protein HYH03_015490 [Edaphochlamys debaryana]|eukprot:KAG2485778.1 hypothetical protein HYH03_015490 [Edaphochlamys debaryana]